MYTELCQFLPLKTPKDSGWAIAIINYGQEHDLLWVVAQDGGTGKDGEKVEPGEIWMWRNPDVRMYHNITMGRKERK